MKSNLFFLSIFLVCSSLFAQTDLDKRPVTIGGLNAIEPENSNTSSQNSGLTLKIPSVVNNNTVSPTPEENKSLITTEDFLDPGDYYLKKLNKKPNPGNENIAAIKGNQHLGDFKSAAKAVKIYCRDFQYVDGDRVRILVNDVVVHNDVWLNSNYKTFTLELQPGFNKIDFQALNQGTSGPNTAELQIIDIDGNLVSANQWNLATGYKASIIIVKE